MKQWWNNLTLRERRLVLSGGLALLLISLLMGKKALALLH